MRTIQELAEHAGNMTTMRYMHLTQSAVDEAIRVLEKGSPFVGQQVANRAISDEEV